jgi:hypothetical protein
MKLFYRRKHIINSAIFSHQFLYVKKFNHQYVILNFCVLMQYKLTSLCSCRVVLNQPEKTPKCYQLGDISALLID